MMSNQWQKVTAQTPSGFVMPISGAIYGIGLGMTTGAACTAPTFVVRDRHVAGAALTEATRPGTTSWSPPTC
jgi:hypothetical protein